MEAEHVHGSRAQATLLPLALKPQVYQIGDGSGWSMVSGNPFRVHEIDSVSERRSNWEKTREPENFSRWWLRRRPG